MIVAPSGAGKSSLVNALLADDASLKLSLSTTTRSPRPGEIDGKDYRFVGKEQFLREREKGHFLEWAEVHGHFYGTSKPWIESQMQSGSDVILEIDWQGAQQIRKLIQPAYYQATKYEFSPESGSPSTAGLSIKLLVSTSSF